MIRVVKVGGSLFDLLDLPDRLRSWLSRQTPAHHVVLAGGGPLVDELRQRHAVQPMDEATTHWACIDFMAATAKTLHGWLPAIPLVDDVGELRRRVAAVGATIFDAGSWLRRVEPDLPGTRLPATWATTSDSIAGRLAVALGAGELVLLKSALPAAGMAPEVRELAAAGYVDAMFPRLAAELPATRLVDLRGDLALEVQLPRIGVASRTAMWSGTRRAWPSG